MRMHIQFNTVSLQNRFCFLCTGCARKLWWFTIIVTLNAIFQIEFFTLHYWKEEFKTVILSG